MEKETLICTNKDRDFNLNLILSLISYAQSEKEGFRHYTNTILGKEYSKEEVKSMLEQLRNEINIQKFGEK